MPWCADSTGCEAVHNARYMLKVCLQGQPLQHSPYSKSNWFTEFCKSLCLSQFTASFISVWAKASIAECIDKFLKEIDTAKKVQTTVRQQGCCNPPLSPHNPAVRSSLQCPHSRPAMFKFRIQHANDPSTGSPTETLLRLLLPLSDKAHKIYHTIFQQTDWCSSPNYSPDHSIGRSDGRCVQRAGT